VNPCKFVIDGDHEQEAQIASHRDAEQGDHSASGESPVGRSTYNRAELVCDVE
jgi:hypothetical protein